MADSSDHHLWHLRFGHINDKSLKRIEDHELVKGMSLGNAMDRPFCEYCVLGKSTRTAPKPVGEIRSTKKLELIHSDVCGPMQTKTPGGNRYMITFIDDHTRCTDVLLMKTKDQALDRFEEFCAKAIGESGERVGTLRTDRGGEYVNDAFKKYLHDNHIHHQTSCPDNPDQNGVAERYNRTIMEKTRPMLTTAGLPKMHWGESVTTSAYLSNRTPHRGLKGRTPFEKWYG